MYFDSSSSWKTFEIADVAHNIPPERLKFILGRAGFNVGRQFNGFFTDVHFKYEDGAFSGSLKKVQNQFLQNEEIPFYHYPSYQKFKVVDCEQTFTQEQFKYNQITLTKGLRGAT